MSIYHKPGERPRVIACMVFGGRSPKTGKLVWSRHRWENDFCIFCHQHRSNVLTTLEPSK